MRKFAATDFARSNRTGATSRLPHFGSFVLEQWVVALGGGGERLQSLLAADVSQDAEQQSFRRGGSFLESGRQFGGARFAVGHANRSGLQRLLSGLRIVGVLGAGRLRDQHVEILQRHRFTEREQRGLANLLVRALDRLQQRGSCRFDATLADQLDQQRIRLPFRVREHRGDLRIHLVARKVLECGLRGESQVFISIDRRLE